MSEAEQFYVRESGAERTVECALLWHGLPQGVTTPLPLSAVEWSERGRSIVDRLIRNAMDVDKSEAKELPYRDLRAALQARIAGLVLLRGRIVPRDNDVTPLFTATGVDADILRLAHIALLVWIQTTLRPWAEQLGLDARDVDDLEIQAEKRHLFQVTECDPVPSPNNLPNALTDFRACSDPLLGVCASVLDRQELFPGLGPVHRIVSRDYDNTLSLETMPTSRGDDLFSMFIDLSVETRPSSRRPVLTVRAGKRIWCREFPQPSQLYGRRAITVRAVISGESTFAVSLDVALGKAGKPNGFIDALLLSTNRLAGELISSEIEDLVHSRGRLPSLFVGIPFKYGYRPSVRLEFGVTLQDQFDVFSEVSTRLEPFGFKKTPLRVLDKIPNRPIEYHVQANIENLIAHHFGRVPIQEIPNKTAELFGAPPEHFRKAAEPIAKTVDLQPMVVANKERLSRAFGAGQKVKLIYICRREQEERIFRSVVDLLFGGDVEVVRYSLPDGVHGSRRILDGDEKLTRRARAEKRNQAWRPLAEEILRDYPGAAVIVQAAKRYDRSDEDVMNKHCGRNALATIAGCNVQYLLPPVEGKPGEYLHRVQAALYDLLFAHAGLGPVPASVITSTFPDLDTRPRTILGIMVVSQARSRRGRPSGAEIAVAARVDVETGRISAHLGYVDASGRMKTCEFLPLGRALVQVARAGQTSLGPSSERGRNFMTFLRAVLENTASLDPNAIVLVDATNIAGLWRWLSDRQFSSDVFLGDASERLPAAWGSLRFVRIREQAVGRVAIHKERSWVPVHEDGSVTGDTVISEAYATAIERLVESIAGPEDNPMARHYLAVHGFGIRNRGARGQSVYRAREGFTKAGRKTEPLKAKRARVLFKRGTVAEWTLPSRIPSPLEISVVPATAGSDADSIASLVYSLRSGYAHTTDGTSLPAPLSFKSKIADYMDRYLSGAVDDYAIEDSDIADTQESDLEPVVPVGSPVTFGEVRRWFEGSFDFNEEDIPLAEEEEADSFDFTAGRDNYHHHSDGGVSSLHDDMREVGIQNEDFVTTGPFEVSNEHQEPMSATEMSTRTEQQANDTKRANKHSDLADLAQSLRSPSVMLPEFADEAFFADTLHIVPSDIRRMHEDRKWIQDVTGFPWPEERPSVEDMPRLYKDALRYPAFSIFVQQRYFDDRGFPKPALIRKRNETLRRLRRDPKMAAKLQTKLSVHADLTILDETGDERLVLTELMSLPGQAASTCQCDCVIEGLDDVIERGGKVGVAGKYVKDIVSPFAEFGSMTVQEAFEARILPATVNTTDAQRHVTVPTSQPASPTSGHQASELDEIVQLWNAQAGTLRTEAEQAIVAGPNSASVAKLKSTLEEMERLGKQAEALTPQTVPSESILTKLRSLVRRILAPLAELVGELPETQSIEATISKIGAEVLADSLKLADEHLESAQAAFSSAENIAHQIANNEASYPKLKANQLNSLLYKEQADSLGESLRLVSISISALAGNQLPKIDSESPNLTTPSAAVQKSLGDGTAPNKSTEDRLEDEPEDLAYEALEDELPPEKVDIDLPAPVLPIKDTADATAESDPLRDMVIEGLDRLFRQGEFGLAYHLAKAMLTLTDKDQTSSVGLEYVYQPIEFLLAAAAGRQSELTSTEMQELADARRDAPALVQKLGNDDPRSIARRIMLLAATIPAALLRQDDLGAAGLVNQIGAVGPTSPFFHLISAVDENRKRGYPITATNLAAVAALANEKRFVEEAVQRIRASIDSLRAARFRFALGEKIKHASLAANGVLGRLERGLSDNVYRVTKETAGMLQTRDTVLDLLEKISGDLSNSVIDGHARERLVMLLLHIGQQCAELTRSFEDLASLRRNASRAEAIMRLRDTIVAGIERVESETTTAGGTPLVDAAYRHAAKILKGLLPLLRGPSIVEMNSVPLDVSLHGPLLWLPGLSWTGSWEPEPPDAETLVQSILNTETPLLGTDPSASIEKAFQARMAEGAFVAATTLLSLGRFYGLSEARIATLREHLEANKEVRKANVLTKLEGAKRLVERMRRMAIGSLEQSNRLSEALATIDERSLPIELPSNFLPGSVEGIHIEDFNAALQRIEGVEKEAQRELQKAKESYASRIDDLSRTDKVDANTARELRNLLDDHELTTLADWLNMIERDENRRPPTHSGPLNTRLAAFQSVLPSLGQIELQRLEEAVRTGDVFGPLNYGSLDADRRQDAARAVEALVSLKRALKTPANQAAVQAYVETAVSAIFYEVQKLKDTDLTQRRRQTYVYDAQVALPPADPSSLVLPEFGSNTQGSWRLIIIGGSALPTTELIGLSDSAGHRGVIVFILGYLNRDRREQIKLELTKRKRPMLIVDEALIAVALADPEDRRRALLEIAQGFSFADPYKDYGRSQVPPEMFKGRTSERAEILAPFGSHVVFGGRRLGKTALLRHIQSLQMANTKIGFVDLINATGEVDVFEKIAAALPEVLSPKIRTGQAFIAGVRAWLEQDDRRRILLLLDEADNFVQHESHTKFRCINTMLQLQADTKNRFKFVLAGLHNVSRAAGAENSPLAQISNNPLRIGPLIDRDVGDAELLVRGPLAAMGYEFDRREDVWRILSFTNYYPVLIQIFCQELVRLLHNQVAHPSSRHIRSISADFVEKAITSSDVRHKLFETFDKTISGIEQRYKLLTYILAQRELLKRESGIAGEGLTPAEVAEQAIRCWPKAFVKGSDPIEIEYLLEEMEGFGIARRTAAGRFALRSRMLLELMAADETDLSNKLDQFRNKERPPHSFDPKNSRRVLPKAALKFLNEERVSPLTDGQEADILGPNAEKPVVIIFGNKHAGIDLVEAALLTSRRVRDREIEIDIKSFATKKEFLDNARKPISAGSTRLLVLISKSSWTPDWVVEAERLALIREGQLRIIFIAGPKHAQECAGDPVMRRRELPNVRRVKLRPWSRTFLMSRMEELQVSMDLMEDMLDATGGWNELIDPLLNQIADAPGDARAKISQMKERNLASLELLQALGVPIDLSGFMKTLAAYIGGPPITSKDFQDLCTEEKVDPKVVGTYGDLVGIFSFPPDEGNEHPHRRVEFNPLALAALQAG
jgi:hypothetical protein